MLYGMFERFVPCLTSQFDTNFGPDPMVYLAL